MENVAQSAKSWPFEQARALLVHIEKKGKKPGDLVTFETGYGPSGAPHIGTFGEVIRTLWVMRAFNELTGSAYQTRLIMFSDDYDALRKRPDDMPLWLEDHLGRALSLIPNPYEDSPGDSFGQANNLKLAAFVSNLLLNTPEQTRVEAVDRGPVPQRAGVFLVSSSAYYQGGHFNDVLRIVEIAHEKILGIMRANMGDARGQTYCAFMPVQADGYVIHENVRVSKDFWGVLEFEDATNNMVSYSTLDGNAKLQWKVDWAARWVALDVDYEMSGKDLIESVKVSSKICRALGGVPPLNMTYELFLDENGEKISKSRGNGVSIDQWLTLGSSESLAYFMYQNPRSAKNLYLAVIPRVMDEYQKQLATFLAQPSLDNPVWHIHLGSYPAHSSEVTYSLMLNLAQVSQAKEASVLTGYLEQYREISPAERHYIDSLSRYAVNYQGSVGPARTLRDPTPLEAKAFLELAAILETLSDGLPGEDYQYHVYEVGKSNSFEPLRSWFQAIYEVLFGASDGPRFGTFIAAYGVQQSVELLRKAGAREEANLHSREQESHPIAAEGEHH